MAKKSESKVVSVAQSNVPAEAASTNPVPTNVSVPPSGWVAPARLGEGRRPKNGLTLAASELAGELRTNASALLQELGSKAVDPQQLAAALDAANGWDGVDAKASTFETYTRTQRAASWDAAVTLMGGMKLGVRFALARDATFADRFPGVAKAFAPTHRPKKAAANAAAEAPRPPSRRPPRRRRRKRAGDCAEGARASSSTPVRSAAGFERAAGRSGARSASASEHLREPRQNLRQPPGPPPGTPGMSTASPRPAAQTHRSRRLSHARNVTSRLSSGSSSSTLIRDRQSARRPASIRIVAPHLTRSHPFDEPPRRKILLAVPVRRAPVRRQHLEHERPLPRPREPVRPRRRRQRRPAPHEPRLPHREISLRVEEHVPDPATRRRARAGPRVRPISRGRCDLLVLARAGREAARLADRAERRDAEVRDHEPRRRRHAKHAPRTSTPCSPAPDAALEPCRRSTADDRRRSRCPGRGEHDARPPTPRRGSTAPRRSGHEPARRRPLRRHHVAAGEYSAAHTGSAGRADRPRGTHVHPSRGFAGKPTSASPRSIGTRCGHRARRSATGRDIRSM